jgi:hypothetical protein
MHQAVTSLRVRVRKVEANRRGCRLVYETAQPLVEKAKTVRRPVFTPNRLGQLGGLTFGSTTEGVIPSRHNLMICTVELARPSRSLLVDKKGRIAMATQAKKSAAVPEPVPEPRPMSEEIAALAYALWQERAVQKVHRKKIGSKRKRH